MVLYSAVASNDVASFHAQGQRYAHDTYGLIAEVAYGLSGNPEVKNSWSFQDLNPRCDVAFESGNLLQADVTGLPSGTQITPYQRNTGVGSYTARPEGTTFSGRNSQSFVDGAIVVFPEVYAWDLNQPLGQEMQLVAAGETPVGASGLGGTVWISFVGVATTNQSENTAFLRETVISHESFHLVTRLSHNADGNWGYLAQVVSSPGGPRFVWNGATDITDITSVLGGQIFRNPQLMTPVAVTEAGTTRSQCETMRSDPDGYLY